MVKDKDKQKLIEQNDFNDALSKVQSDKVDVRTTGLKGLKEATNKYRQDAKFEDVKDDSYHTALEAVFRVAKTEASNYARASKSTKSRVEGRLLSCASVIRVLVEAGLKKLRYKTVRALVEHITQTLPTTQGDYCEPLLGDYLKALVLLLEYKAHPEHFLGDEWQELMDFCVQMVYDLDSRTEANDSRTSNGSIAPNGSGPFGVSHSRSTTPSMVGDRRIKHSNNVSQRSVASRLEESDTDIILCLLHLTSVPNAPIFDRASVVLTALIELLQNYSRVSSIKQIAFECLNSVMSRIVFNDIDLALDTMTKVMPLLRQFWKSTEATLNEVLMVFLSYGEILLPRLISADRSAGCIATLQALVEVLRTDYCERTNRTQLQLQDLVLVDPTYPSTKTLPLCTSTVQVRMGTLRAESPWCLIARSATIMVALENSLKAEDSADRDDVHHIPKRQRLERPLDDVLRLMKGTILPEKLYALQILVFVFEDLKFDESSLQGYLESILPCVSHNDGLIASWAMVVMASATIQRAAGTANLRDFWLRAWRIVSRQVTSSSTCRAACHLMAYLLERRLVRYADVADIVTGMTRSVDLNGPAECDEAATTLWTILVVLQGREHLNTASETSENVLRWLFGRWSPSRVHDRNHAMYIARQLSTFSTLRLICVCLGLPPPSARPQSALNMGLLSQASLKSLRDLELMNYLLLAEEKAQEKTEVISISKPESPGTKHASTKFQSLATAVLEFFVSEGSALLRAQFTSIAEPTSGINTMTIRISISFSVIAYSLLSHPRLQGLRQRDQLKNILLEIKTAFKTCLQNHDERADFADITFVSFSEFLGPVEQAVQVADLLTHGTIAMSQGLDHHFWHEVLHSGGPSPSNIEPDGIELDEEFESHTSKSRDKSDTFDVTHHEIPAATNVIAFRSCIEAKICFFSGMKQSQDPAVTFASQAASSVIHYLTSLKASDFVLCRNFLRELLDSGIPIIEDDADTLLQYLTHVLIRPYETERSEVSLGVALDIMTCLADMWINNDDSEIAETGSEVYSWFIKNVLKTGIASPHVQTCISKLLQKVIKLRPEYAKSLSLSSARTCLFEVLRKGNLVVKYHIGKDIAEIFGLFVLKEHEYILEDVIENLPKEKNWIEGIALRIFVLAHLAGAWSTLLRKCVYSIFETPKHIPEAAGYAKHGLDHITRSLKLAKSQDLFKLFASQIFYTWLGADQLRSIPYEVFDYATLPKLLVDVQDEIVGQIIIRSNEDEAAQLAEDLSSSFGTLLELSFSKAAAYSIGRDMSLRHDSNNQVSRAEVRLRQYVGKEQYALSISIHFAKIMALFFKRMDVEGQIEKGFQRRAALAKAYSAYQEILSKCAAERSLPPGHQPLFNARYLFDQIEFLCRRTSYDAESLWLPELYVFVFREILNGIHPELGSINACSGLRKLRILISLAGITALEDYPLEMALHSLRPYLTDAQCADDAIGIVQYLLEHGASYLTQIPSFLAGNSVSTLTSMKAFFESTQDSTTQESQFRTTMSRAQSFHTWFVGFLEKYKSPHLDEDSARCFKTIIRTASKIQNGGNARLGTYESELLLEVLEDQRSGRNLLDHSSVETILKFLCSPFEVPSDFRDDILGSDQQAARYAPTVWKTCQRGISSSNYLLWAGRVLGRAYAGKGLMDREMAFETNLHAEPNAVMMSATTPSSNSRSKILHSLCNLLLGDRSTEVGLVESTLRSIATGTDGTEYSLDCEQSLAPSLARSMLWRQYRLPATDFSTPKLSSLQECVTLKEHQQGPEWIQQLCKALANTARDDPILSELIQALDCINGLAEEVFPYILHLVLLREAGTHQTTKSTVSDACCQYFNECINDQNNETVIFCVRILLNAILYLRTQPLPQEASKADRFHWLDLDYQQAAAVALKCSMYKTAMLFVEVAYSVAAKASRRTSGIKFQDPTQLLLEIFENIDEQDAFYGVQQPSSLSSMMARLEYEHAGFKSLSFRGAHYDGQIRYSSGGQQIDEEGMVRALDSLDLNGLSQSVLGRMTVTGPNAIDSVLRTARKLEQWDITAPASRISTASTLFRAFQSLNYAVDSPGLLTALNTGFADSMSQLMAAKGAKLLIHATLGALAILTEVDEVFSAKKPDQLLEVLARFGDRETWMHSESYDHVKAIISCRETIFSTLSKKSKLQDMTRISQRDARSLESHLLLASSRMSRLHGALQNSLSTVTYMTQLIKPCKGNGIDISAAVRLESAEVLWSQGEMAASINILQDLQKSLGSPAQLIEVGKPELLAKLGHQIAEARLEKPDEIINSYLTPAIRELHGKSEGEEAGEVFHEFASFCDRQLQNSDGLEDFQRIRKLRERKEEEVRDLDRMIKAASSQGRERDNLKTHRVKAQQWFDLDDREFQRLRASRQTFLRQSLENYLLCLKACDKYDNDALRFSALWLENYENEIANEAVSNHVDQVGSRKFAALMNQWSSRLLDVGGQFQSLLSSLVLRICVDHPYHGMYQIFTGSKTKVGKDETAIKRNAAANKIVQQLKADKYAEPVWVSIHNTNISFVKFAGERLTDPSIKPGSKVALRKYTTGQRVEQDVLKLRVPPPTMKIDLRSDCDYSDIPFIARFQPEFAVASGISAPKILTAVGTDGLKYKQLFKSGQDDLRQDSIMEQVFEQVSNLLKSQRATRQRNLRIRTYKVLPLTATSGIIEFVSNTVPLHDYLMPAHQRHFPRDLKNNQCRKHIADAQSKSVDQRIKTYRSVCDQFHPVLRYFFLEGFENPDIWFEKRLAYTRSTAAISILGHVLGLGDRHGHNILLDEKTGEVVHIDLGIAFEQGRVLGVPEVVPFRLTRDLVDGMGVTKTEGVFRRCCEFTLEALRNESYSIMTILDVLRYDPLYSWSLSPLRLKKMQEVQTENLAVPRGDEEGGKRENEPGEADRALTVVAKKLSKSLSVTATVNELIQQATDERNLAVLFCGWAAYA